MGFVQREVLHFLRIIHSSVNLSYSFNYFLGGNHCVRCRENAEVTKIRRLALGILKI